MTISLLYDPTKIKKNHPFFRLNGVQIKIGNQELPEEKYDLIKDTDYFQSLVESQAIVISGEKNPKKSSTKKPDNSSTSTLNLESEAVNSIKK